MSRKDDLEHYIRDSYAIIVEYEEQIPLSNRPEEIKRAEKVIAKQWAAIAWHLPEYRALSGGDLSDDIAQIADHPGLPARPTAPPPDIYPDYSMRGPCHPDVYPDRGERDLRRPAALGAGAPLFAGVPPMPNHVLGRDDLIDSSVAMLTSGKALALAVEGPGGVGKTTLAVALAYHGQILAQFTGGVLWASLGPQADLMRALAAWAQALGKDISSLPQVEDRRQAVKTLIGQRRMLLIIDDAWQIEAAGQLRCGGPHCCHVLTTRDRQVARQFAGAARVRHIRPLDKAPAYALLQTLAPEICATEPEATQALVRTAGGLPLALSLLGGYLCDATAISGEMFGDLAGETLAELDAADQRLKLAQARLGAPGQAVTLAQALALSLEALPVAAAGAFYALGAFAPRPERFDRQAAQAVTGCGARTLALLAARNLVEVEGLHFLLHPVLSDLARSRPDAGAAARHRDHYLALANQDREDWRQIKAA